MKIVSLRKRQVMSAERTMPGVSGACAGLVNEAVEPNGGDAVAGIRRKSRSFERGLAKRAVCAAELRVMPAPDTGFSRAAVHPTGHTAAHGMAAMEFFAAASLNPCAALSGEPGSAVPLNGVPDRYPFI